MRSRTRPNIDRYHREYGMWSRRAGGVSAAAAAEIEREMPAPKVDTPVTRERFAHPVIEAPSHKCYRVIRRFKDAEGLQFEDIGAVPSLRHALAISMSEIGYAVVLDPNNRQVSSNGQPLQERA